jgi:hypothetical protein
MYFVTVKIEDIERRRRSAGLLHILPGFFLIAKGADYYKYLDYQNFIPVFPVFAFGLLSLAYGFFRKRLDLTAKWNYWIRLAQVVGFTGLGIVFLKLGKPLDYWSVFVFTALSILLLFSERKIFQETIIYFDENGIRIPGSYREHRVLWEDISEVVVREDFLTIFHIKKKYLQYQVMQDLSTLETVKMNAFCKERISAIQQTQKQHNGRGIQQG